MAKHYITVQWSTTVKADIPEGMKPADLIDVDYSSPEDVQEFACAVTQEAWHNIRCDGWKGGVITDVQPVEDEP